MGSDHSYEILMINDCREIKIFCDWFVVFDDKLIVGFGGITLVKPTPPKTPLFWVHVCNGIFSPKERRSLCMSQNTHHNRCGGSSLSQKGADLSHDMGGSKSPDLHVSLEKHYKNNFFKTDMQIRRFEKKTPHVMGQTCPMTCGGGGAKNFLICMSV